MSVDIEKAFKFIEINGDEFQKNFLKCLFGENNLSNTLEELSKYQNSDGGWIKIDPDYIGTVSSITCTMAGFGKLERLKVAKSIIIDTSIDYLKKVQKPSGMWDEPTDIINFNIPRWYYPRIQNNQIWFTNGMLRYVISRGPEEQEMIKKARKYLRAFWNGHGFPGYQHNNWMGIVSFFNGDEDVDEGIYQGCLKNLRNNVEEYDLADIAWTLESCHFIGLTQDEAVVTKCLELLSSGQMDDGGFGTEYGSFQRADVTIEALDSLADYGLLPRRFTLHP